MVKVKKLHKDAVLPKSANETDAGYDLVAIDDGRITDTYIEYRTGIAIQPPHGYHTELFPRSSISKYDLVLANSVGVIDEEYRSEVLVRMKIIKNSSPPILYKKGDKIAQLLIRKTEKMEFQEVENLDDNDRGGGFGSTGN